MAAVNSMTHSSDSSGTPERHEPNLDLVFPVGGFVATLPPLISIEEMIERSRQLREWFPDGVRSAEERWKAKTDVPFVL